MAYADLTERVADVLPETPVDAIGFSLGAMTLLRLAIAEPHRFNRIVLAGIGKNIFERTDEGTKAIVAGLELVAGGGDPSGLENTVRLFTQYAGQPGNDLEALTAVMKRPESAAITPEGVRRSPARCSSSSATATSSTRATSLLQRSRTADARRCATSITSPRPSRSASSTLHSNSSTPSDHA